jgi:NADH dehydrogenase
MSETVEKRVLIVGGGFGGIKAALELADDERFKVLLLSDKPNFRYYPSLFETATGKKAALSSIALESIFAEESVDIAIGTVDTLDRKAKTIHTTNGRVYPYDILILALGVVTNYFGIKGLEEYAYGIKSLEEAERLKAHLHKQLTDEHKPDLNYVIIGGGPTGIELSGQLPQYIHRLMKNHGIKDRNIHIDLVEAAPSLVPRSPKDTQRAIAAHLRKLGIKLYLGQTVQAETADSLLVNGKPISSHTVIWTAGVTNNPFFKDNFFALTDRGKVIVNDFLQSEPDIYVIGDNANTKFSGMAQTALYDAIFVAHTIKRTESGERRYAYQPKEPISVIPAGPHWAAVSFGKIRAYGWAGWLLRQAADFVAFHDIEPWWKANAQWLEEFGDEDDCSTCKHAEQSRL